MKIALCLIFVLFVCLGIGYIFVDPYTLLARPTYGFNILVAVLLIICGIIGASQILE